MSSDGHMQEGEITKSTNAMLKSGSFSTKSIIMPSKMEVASQHCDTVPNKTKDILDTVKKDFLNSVLVFAARWA